MRFAATRFSTIPLRRLAVVSTCLEFRSSGWTDATAFGIANTLDFAFSHMLVGPLVGARTGGIAGVVGHEVPWRTPSAPIHG
jgi:hypothetical protein